MRVGAFTLGLGLIVAGARADEALRNEVCAGSYERAQLMMKNRKLIDAGRELDACLANCPGALKRDCEKWSAEQTHALASVELEVRDEKGMALRAARVEVDGRALSPDQSLTSLTIDPGTHVLRVTVLGRDAQEVTVALSAGEKARRVAVVFASMKVLPPSPPPSPSLLKAPRKRRIPATAYVLGGVALASTIVGGALVLHGIAKRSELASTCGVNGGCSPSELDGVRAEWLWGGIALGTGGAAFGVAALVFALTPPQGAAQVVPAHAKMPTPYGFWVSGTW